jgi:putative transposase
VPALEQFLGSTAGLLSATITRLTKQWTDDYRLCARDLASVDYVYMWADRASTSTSGSRKTNCACS